jgi:hypothetical protein
LPNLMTKKFQATTENFQSPNFCYPNCWLKNLMTKNSQLS